jgi:thymidine phosphorylase
MRQVVEQQGACIAWGGSVSLSPADDIIIRVERALDLDSEGQLVASVISKKVAAGSTHVLIDIPVGPTAKVRNQTMAEHLANVLKATGERLGLAVDVVISDGTQPVGRGIGPALEARDVVSVLRGEPQAPEDLTAKSLMLAGRLLEMAQLASEGEGYELAQNTLESGAAWNKFMAICEAQGGMREPPKARYTSTIRAKKNGIVAHMHTHCISRLAKLAGAPASKAAGLELHVRLGDRVETGMPLFTLHAEAKGELNYALEFLQSHPDTLRIEEETI